MNKHLPIILLFFYACASPTTSETTSDSTTVATDTLALVAEEGEEPTEEDGYADDGERPAPVMDSVTTDLETTSNFMVLQIFTNNAYVYRRDGLPVYAGANDLNEASPVLLGTLAYGSPVKLDKDLVGVPEADVYDGLRGKLIPIKYGDQTGYIFSGWLLNIPVPEEPGIKKYLMDNLHLLYGTKKKIFPSNLQGPDADEVTSEHEMWQFEYNMNYNKHQYYEDSNEVLEVPSLGMQETYLLACHLIPGFEKHLPKFPTEEMDTNEEGSIIKVIKENGRVVRIHVVIMEDCETEIEIFHEDVLQLKTSTGC